MIWQRPAGSCARAVETRREELRLIRETCGEDAEACTTEYLRELNAERRPVWSIAAARMPGTAQRRGRSRETWLQSGCQSHRSGHYPFDR